MKGYSDHGGILIYDQNFDILMFERTRWLKHPYGNGEVEAGA